MSHTRRIFVRSLPGSERRSHMEDQMSNLNWDFQFWDNTHYESEEFDSFVRGGGVRLYDDYMVKVSEVMGKKHRKSNANLLFPTQVANHISVRNLLRHIAYSDYEEDFFYIMEDDLIIKSYADNVLSKKLPSIKSDKFICGIGWGWTRKRSGNHRDYEESKYNINTNIFRFCNPFFITNKATAKYICENLMEDYIDLPCDVWLHRYTSAIDKNIKRMIIFPALCRDLSFSGQFDSDILPKSARIRLLSSKKNISTKDQQSLSDLRVKYDDRFKDCKEFWRSNYGL